MEIISGEFVMRGCDSSEAFCSIEDVVSLIHQIGFLPLFSNEISGFSEEEHVPADVWWTGDSHTDPWEWRMILAEDHSIAYGKFFSRAAGFVSKDFFPLFANYRRNGYDFDSLFDDGLASYRSKKIMDVFGKEPELLTYQLKERAGFGKRADDGQTAEKNFEGCLTDLQMQTYLVISSFHQKKNKKGLPYGWHIAAIEPPEVKWGRDFVVSSYTEDPEQSWEKIVNRVKEYYSTATDEQIRKVLGIKYPGAERPTATTEKIEKKPSEKKPALLWPENLMQALVVGTTNAEKEGNMDSHLLNHSGSKIP